MVPNTKTAIKRDRQSKARRFRNKATRSALKTTVRRFERALHTGDAEAAGDAMRRSCRLLDKAAGKGIIHQRKADRKKSQMARQLQALQ